MDLTKLATAEIRNFDAPKLREVERDIRRELLNVRMDIFTAPATYTGKVRNLKLSLARIRTVQTERARKVTEQPKPKKTKA
jgi:ribosomal protein L29